MALYSISPARPRRRPCDLAVHAVLFVLVVGLVAAVGCSKETVPVIDSLVVLRFDNSSDDAAEEYFASGVTEALIDRLGHIHSLRVIGWPSAMRVREGDTDAEITDDWQLGAVVRGTVLQTADAVRVTVDCTDMATGEVTSSSADGQLSDIDSMLNSLTRDIANACGVKLTDEEDRWLSQGQTVVPDAYRAYLHGRFVANQRRLESLEKSIDYYSQAIESDPGFGPAYAAMADAYIAMGTRGFVASKDAFPQAEELARKALEIDPSLPAALSALAYVNFVYNWDWETAGQQFEQAIELDPGDSLTRGRYAELLDAMDRLPDAMAQMGHAEDIDPNNPDVLQLRGRLLIRTTNRSALDYLKRSLRMDPSAPDAHLEIARWELIHGQHLNAVKEYCEAYRLAGWSDEDVAALRSVYSNSGVGAFLVARAEMVEAMDGKPGVLPLDGYFGAAEGLARTPLREATIEALEKYREAKGPRFVTLNVDPFFRIWKADSVFVAYLNDVGFDVEVARVYLPPVGNEDHGH